MTGPTSSARPTGAKRRRPMLLSFTALGVVVGLLGVAGVFATSSDRATTGQNDARSGDLPPEPKVDLQITRAYYDRTTYEPTAHTIVCRDEWTDDLATGIVTTGGSPLPPGLAYDGHACVRNMGDEPADVTITAIDVVDTEIGCAPGEAEAGDASCGSGAGELAGAMKAIVRTRPNPGLGECDELHTNASLLALSSAPVPVARLEPGASIPVCLYVSWDGVDPKVQSDQVSWRYAFDGVTAG